MNGGSDSNSSSVRPSQKNTEPRTKRRKRGAQPPSTKQHNTIAQHNTTQLNITRLLSLPLPSPPLYGLKSPIRITEYGVWIAEYGVCMQIGDRGWNGWHGYAVYSAQRHWTTLAACSQGNWDEQSYCGNWRAVLLGLPLSPRCPWW